MTFVVSGCSWTLATLLLFVSSAAYAGQTRPEPLRIDPLTATIAGRISTADTGVPIRRAEIRAISERGLTRIATTDDDGRYVVRDLPAGTFTVHVSKSGFVPLYFGQRRPFERRSTVELAQGQRGSADVRLPRAGAITGRIVDTTGEPVMGASVQALRRRMVDGQRGLQSVGLGDTTDDTGAYRLYGLPPGEYYVTATPRRIEDRAGRPVADVLPGRGAPIFYPGTANRDEAVRLTVDVSGEARADMQLMSVQTSRVTGVVLSANGAPAAGAMISLLSRDLDFSSTGMGMPTMPLQIQGDAGADGTFALEGVPPGSFVLRAQTRPQMPVLDPATRKIAVPFTPTMEVAIVPVAVNGDINGLTVTTSEGGTVDVVVVTDPAASGPPPPNVRVTVRTGDRNELGMSHTGSAKMALSLASQSRVLIDGLPDGWAVKALMLDNQDVTDKPIDVRNAQNMTLRVILTDRTSDVAGRIALPSNDNSAEVTVVVFAEDDRKWAYPSRFVRVARTSDRGAFRISALPPNEDYRAVAVDYLEDGEETDPELLSRLRDRATRFSLREGEQRVLDLRVIQR